MIDAPRVFHPGDDDKPGYWQDFGITTAFDFSTASNTLVAVIKETNGPSRLFIFDLERGTIRFQPTISKREIRSVRLLSTSYALAWNGITSFVRLASQTV
jgi:hypothetical protein